MVRGIRAGACLVLALGLARAEGVELLGADMYRMVSGRVVHLAGVVAFQVEQGCPRGASAGAGGSPELFACGVAAMEHAGRYLVDESLVCRGTGGAAVWRWVASSVAEDDVGSELGQAVWSVPVRCSSHSVSDVSVALVAAGFAVPLDGASLEVRDAYRAAKRSGAGVWGQADGVALVHPAQWIRSRVDRIRSTGLQSGASGR